MIADASCELGGKLELLLELLRLQETKAPVHEEIAVGDLLGGLCQPCAYSPEFSVLGSRGELERLFELIADNLAGGGTVSLAAISRLDRTRQVELRFGLPGLEVASGYGALALALAHQLAARSDGRVETAPGFVVKVVLSVAGSQSCGHSTTRPPHSSNSASCGSANVSMSSNERF